MTTNVTTEKQPGRRQAHELNVEPQFDLKGCKIHSIGKPWQRHDMCCQHRSDHPHRESGSSTCPPHPRGHRAIGHLKVGGQKRRRCGCRREFRHHRGKGDIVKLRDGKSKERRRRVNKKGSTRYYNPCRANRSNEPRRR